MMKRSILDADTHASKARDENPTRNLTSQIAGEVIAIHCQSVFVAIDIDGAAVRNIITPTG
jgi:hypothetical protein